MPTASQVSRPLPLPFGFTLLPSQLPGRQLTPLLYTSLNGLPIYLTISPSHPPHISFLPILLALKVSITPLSLLVEYGLSPNQFSLNIDGTAPWDDLWVQLDVAREIIRELGAGRIFWDEKGRGMLGKVEDAVSWEEGDGWYHNWLPSKSHLPSSSYSLDTLLSTSWTFIEIIPDDRCVFTACGKQRSAKLESDALSFDSSMLRSGVWGTAWDTLLDWTTISWTQYQLSPSRFPNNARSRHRLKDPLERHPMTDLLRVLPGLFGVTPSTSIPLNTTDLLRLAPSPTIQSITQLSLLLVTALYRQAISLLPALTFLTPRSLRPNRANEVAQQQWRARINLALCALVSDLIIGIWRLRSENDKLRSLLHTRGQPPPIEIVVEPMPRDPNPVNNHRKRTSDRERGGRPSHRRSHRHPNRSSTSTASSISPSSSEELDVIIELEKRRGGSPPPVTPSSRPSKRQNEQPSGRGSQSRHSRQEKSEPITPTATARRRRMERIPSLSPSSGSSSSVSIDHLRSRSSIKRPSQIVTTPSSISILEEEILDDKVHQSRKRVTRSDHDSEDEEDVKLTKIKVERETKIELDDYVKGRSLGTDASISSSEQEKGNDLVNGTDRRDGLDHHSDTDTNDDSSTHDETEVEAQLLEGHHHHVHLEEKEEDDEQEKEKEKEKEKEGIKHKEPNTDILTPTKPRRIHPWPSLVFSLLAVVAAYCMLNQNGPIHEVTSEWTDRLALTLGPIVDKLSALGPIIDKISGSM